MGRIDVLDGGLGSSVLTYPPPGSLRLIPFQPYSMSYARCLELLFRTVPEDKGQGDFNSQFSSELSGSGGIGVGSFLCVLG